MNKIYQKSFPGGKTAGFTLIKLLIKKRHSRGMLSGISALIYHAVSRFLSCCLGLVSAKKAGDPRTLRAATSSGMTALFNKGFTLIELLVVVLIIGILAAIALPQYQKTVARSRLAGMITLASSVAQAEQRYFMANGEYTVEAENLDVELPRGMTLSAQAPGINSYSDGKRIITLYQEGVGGAGRISVHYDGIPSFILWGFDPSRYRDCGVSASSAQVELGKNICASYGVPAGDGSSSGGYYYYKLN